MNEIPRGAVEAIENAVLRGMRKANMNRLKERGSGETAAPADAAHGLIQPTPAIVATDSPQHSTLDGGHAGDRDAEMRQPAPVETNWRESDAIKQARTWLVQINDPLWPGYNETEWADLLRAVLAERDFLGEWLQRYLDVDPAHDEALVPVHSA